MENNLNWLHFTEINSTNTYLKENVRDLPDKTVVTADLQTAGRGRLGNIWEADNNMLPVSILLKSRNNAVSLTIMTAISVCRAIEKVCDIPAQIKWTNDIICENHKVCGILCESIIKGAQIDVVCGIGVNVNQPTDFFERNSLPNAASLFEITGSRLDKKQLAQEIINQLLSLLDDDFENVRCEYEKRCITLNKQVKLIINGEEKIAYAKAIGKNGSLVCIDDNGEFEVVAGEVKVRGLNNEYL